MKAGDEKSDSLLCILMIINSVCIVNIAITYEVESDRGFQIHSNTEKRQGFGYGCCGVGTKGLSIFMGLI